MMVLAEKLKVCHQYSTDKRRIETDQFDFQIQGISRTFEVRADSDLSRIPLKLDRNNENVLFLRY